MLTRYLQQCARMLRRTRGSGSDRECALDELNLDSPTSTFVHASRRLNRVSKVSTETSILSLPSSLPIFVAPAALARLGHPDGEMNLVRAAGLAGIVQGVRPKYVSYYLYAHNWPGRYPRTRAARSMRSSRRRRRTKTSYFRSNSHFPTRQLLRPNAS